MKSFCFRKFTRNKAFCDDSVKCVPDGSGLLACQREGGAVISKHILYFYALLNGYHKAKKSERTHSDIDIKSFKYLIGQCIRQYQIPEDHYFTSEEALRLWNELTDDNILEFPGKGAFKCNKRQEGKTYNKYIGNCKTPMEYIPEIGKEIKFNDVFHYDLNKA